MRKQENKIKRERGITLVALVVTIVIIVILASVTLVATFGKNGIIKKAELARDLASNSVAKENEDMNRLMYEYTNIMLGGGEVPEPPKDETPPTVSIEVGKITETSIAVTVNAEDKESGLAEKDTYKYYINGEAEPRETSTSNSYTFTGLTAETEYTIKVEAFDKAGNKGENSTTVSTNKSYPIIEEKLKEGDYVTYPSSQGDLKCIVLYDNTSSYGIQIITMDTVDDVTLGVNISLGNNDFTKAIKSYNSAISNLNNKATEYINDTYASDARCVGSVPNDKNHEAGMHKTQFGGEYDGKLRDTDNNYETDYNKMQVINGGIQNIGKNYWLASRIVFSISNNSDFRM